MAEHDTPDAQRHRQSGWYWVRWNRGGLWFPEEWFRGHDGQAFWVRGRARQPAAEVGFRIREMGEDKPEDNAVQGGTPVDSDTLAQRLARDVVSRYIAHTGTLMELPCLENLVKDAIVIALNEREAEIARLCVERITLLAEAGDAKQENARLKQALANKERETIERCAALAEAEPELPGEMPESIRRNIMSSPDMLARSVCRVTKRSIAKAIRALDSKAVAEPKLPEERLEATRQQARRDSDPIAHFVPRATKRAIIRAVIRALDIGLDNPDKPDNPDK